MINDHFSNPAPKLVVYSMKSVNNVILIKERREFFLYIPQKMFKHDLILNSEFTYFYWPLEIFLVKKNILHPEAFSQNEYHKWFDGENKLKQS